MGIRAKEKKGHQLAVGSQLLLLLSHPLTLILSYPHTLLPIGGSVNLPDCLQRCWRF